MRANESFADRLWSDDEENLTINVDNNHADDSNRIEQPSNQICGAETSNEKINTLARTCISK